MIKLSKKWIKELASKSETGMGYQVVTVILKDKREFCQTVVIDGQITLIRNLDNVPFTEDQIDQIILTHDKWNFNSIKK